MYKNGWTKQLFEKSLNTLLDLETWQMLKISSLKPVHNEPKIKKKVFKLKLVFYDQFFISNLI